ncbi:MAG: hypothetical protein K1X53_04020 [Candidatus Sumerlaeaceae bacterium]|nr:hypothetical protein [Candidatus Sumerlaeaceae bacterium]
MNKLGLALPVIALIVGAATLASAETGIPKSDTGNAGVATPKPRTIEDDPAYQKFSGLSETDRVPEDVVSARRQGYCKELADTLLTYPGLSFDPPVFEGKPVPIPADVVAGEPFEQLMIHSVPPSKQDSVYVRLTKSVEPRIEKAILASKGQLTPADVMKIALDESQGNARLATLAAHNFLKNITYEGRTQRDVLTGVIPKNPSKTFPARYGDVAAKLVNLRETPQTGVGRTDKMGIWYHSFVVLTISTWVGPKAADEAIGAEYGVRKLGAATNMGSPVDPEKEASDRCFAEATRDAVAGKLLPATSQPEDVGKLDPKVLAGKDSWKTADQTGQASIRIDIPSASFSGDCYCVFYFGKAAFHWEGTMSGTFTGTAREGKLAGTASGSTWSPTASSGKKLPFQEKIAGTLQNGVVNLTFVDKKDWLKLKIPVTGAEEP